MKRKETRPVNDHARDPKSPNASDARKDRALHVAVDLPWDASACMGTGAYSEAAVRGLAGVAPESTFTLIVPKDAPRSISLPNVQYHTLPGVDVRQEGGRQVALPAFLSTSNIDVLFAPATLLPLTKVCPMVATVHDLLYLRHPEYYASGLVEYLKQWLDPSLETADHLVAISDEAKRDLLELRGVPEQRVSVIRQPVREALSRRLKDADVERIIRDLDIRKPFFFHVSNLSPHKNVVFGLEVFAQYVAAHPNSTHTFVFAGGGVAPNRPPDVEAIAKGLGIEKRVRYAGRVSDGQLKALYQACDAFLYPSLAEGWGLPVAEANGLGIRVLASPHVPAAGPSQRLELTPARWVKVLEDPKAGLGEFPAVDRNASSRQLWSVLRKAAEGKKPAPSRVSTGVSTEGERDPGKRPPADPPKLARGISGCTIIRNGVKLRYPFEESVASYAPICDEIVICWDPSSEDDTAGLVRKIATRFPKVRLVESVWDMSNRQEGTELARQTQVAFGHCQHDWTLYVQADEALHERHHESLKAAAADVGISGVAFRRESFYGTLDREIPEHRTRGMVRMFRTGHGRSLGDAMHVRVENHQGTILISDATLFNYSRLGSDSDIVTRCTNLHRFYHDDPWLASRKPTEELGLRTAPYEGSHPAPIEASFRSTRTIARSGGVAPRVSAHIIAQEPDAFGADLLGSCLDSLHGYADQIVIVDNGLGPEALDAVLRRRGSLPITLIDGRDVVQDFAELRNRALAATAPRMTHLHKIDSDEVYLPGSLDALKGLLCDSSAAQVNATLVHFMIEPSLVESFQPKDVVFRLNSALAWRGAVHETMGGLARGRAVQGPGVFLHFGYCRPQWQTLLKWLRYARLQGSDLSHYKFEFIDGVRRPWFRDGRSPDTILEPRRSRLERYQDVYPPSVRPWLENFSRSGVAWREWVNRRADPGRWKEWQRLYQGRGSWEDTLEEMLGHRSNDATRSSGAPRLPVSAENGAAQTPSPVAPLVDPSDGLQLIRPLCRQGEYRKGFSIIIPTWNNLEYLKKAIESLRKYSDFEHEIVLHVNDGSDGSLDWARANGFRHTHSPQNVGICVAVNKAADLCSRDLVMYWNDDMVALPEWDRHLVDYAESHDLDRLTWLSSTLIEPTGANPSFIAPADYGKDVECFEEERLLADLPSLRDQKPDTLGLTCAPHLLHRETFDRIGRFSEEFSPGFGSDPDLVKKVWDAGGRIFVGIGKSLVYHFQCKGTSKIPKHLHNNPYETFFRKHGMGIDEFMDGVMRRQAHTPRTKGERTAVAPIPATVPVTAEGGAGKLIRRGTDAYRRGFSVIIPTWNNLRYLKKAVESIRTHSEFEHEIIVHVNEGSDGTLQWVRDRGLKYTHTEGNSGVCTAVNRAADLATRDLVMYFNDDMVALPGWDRYLVDFAATHTIDELTWLSSTLIEPTGDNPRCIAPADYGTDLDRFDEKRLIADLPALRSRKADEPATTWPPTLLFRTTFDRIGRFSEEFSPGFGSDPDLAKKVLDLGGRHFVGVGKSLVYHFQCKSTGRLPKHQHNDAEGVFLRKHRMTIHQFMHEVLPTEARLPDLLRPVEVSANCVQETGK